VAGIVAVDRFAEPLHTLPGGLRPGKVSAADHVWSGCAIRQDDRTSLDLVDGRGADQYRARVAVLPGAALGSPS